MTSTTDAVEIAGRDVADGIFKDKFLRFRARLAGDTGLTVDEKMFAGRGDREVVVGASECMAILSVISGILVDLG